MYLEAAGQLTIWQRTTQTTRRRRVRGWSAALWMVAVLVLGRGNAVAQLPAPTHPNLTRLGYYFVNERYGDDTAAVWPYTNLYIAGPELYDTALPDWQTPFAASLQKATVNHKAIFLGVPGDSPLNPSMTWDAMLDVAQNYWGQVKYVGISHEPSLPR